MTISKLAQLNKKNDGLFFDRISLNRCGETQKSFQCRKSSIKGQLTVTRKTDGMQWEFLAKTGRVLGAVQFRTKLNGTCARITA